jgi:hypothetical protein
LKKAKYGKCIIQILQNIDSKTIFEGVRWYGCLASKPYCAPFNAAIIPRHHFILPAISAPPTAAIKAIDLAK